MPITDHPSGTPTDFTKAVPPVVRELEDNLRPTLSRIVARDGSSSLLRRHRSQGTSSDREAAARWLAMRFGEPPSPKRLIVTNGTLNALMMLMASLVGPGGLLLTEAVTFPQILPLSQLLGFRVRGLAMDSQGLIPEALEEACLDADQPKALYCIPTAQNPTSVSMSEGRRRAIAAIARRFKVPVVEDDAQGLIPDTSPLPIATMAPELTWYVMGLAKCIAMGLRAAFILTPSEDETVRLMARFGRMSMWFIAPIHAALAAEWITDGTALRILHAIRRETSARRELAADILGRSEIATAPRAHHLWLPLSRDTNPDDFADFAERRGILVRSGMGFHVLGTAPDNARGIRISLADPADHEKLRLGLRTLAALLREFSPAVAAASGAPLESGSSG
jgi:DNA-binding transcriptional MocR family regulator